MDPSRHREYIASNEERSRLHTSAAYYSRDIPDVAAHRYYGSSTAAVQPTTHPPPPPPGGPARSHSNTRISCDCTTTPSGARITCNNCRLNPNGDMWPSASSTSSSSTSGPAANEYHMHREYRQMTTSEATMRTGMRQSSMYMHQQQQQPPPAPPPASNPAAQHMPAGLMQHPGGHPPPPPTSSQSIMQTHTISRTNYWPQNPSSTSQHYGEEHIHGPGPGPGHHPHAHHQQQQHTAVVPPPHQATTTQTQIESSITRRPAANALGPNGAPLDAGNMYGQYKSVSHPSHSGSSYPAQQPAPPQPSSTNPVHHQQQQHQPQQRVSAIGGGSSGQTPPMIGASNSHYITKEQRVYQTKYSSTTTTTKIAYNATATSTAVYDSHHPHPQHVGSANKTSSASLPIDHHVINPSNLPNSKEQHPSPNYARKCPQMYTPETAAEQSTVHQHHHHHHNLYMTTPQFSSDKFSRASPQQLPTSDYTKLRESPSGAVGASPYMVSSGDNKYSHIPPSPSSSHLRESPQFVSSPQAPPRNANAYYNNSNPPNHHHHHQQPPPPAAASSKVHPPEMSPIIMKQSPHPHYQYSRSPLQPPPSAAALPPSASHSQLHQMPGNKMSSNAPAAGGGLAAPPPPPVNPPPLSSSQRYLMDNVKREDLEIYESSPQHPSRGSTVGGAAAAGSAGIYINPYNTPPPTGGDSCCKEVTASSPYTIVGSATPNYRVESPQFYGTKYGKMSTTTGSEKHAALLQQNTPPPSRAPSQRGGHPGGQPAAYYYDGNPHSAPSPAAATAASPSPSSALLASSTTTSQTHIHHTEYVTTTIQGPACHAMPPQSSYPPSQPMGQHHQAAGLRNAEMLPYERAMPPLQNHAQPPAGMKHGGHTSTMVPVQQNVSSVPSSQHHNASKIPVNPVGGSSKNKPNYRELITRQLAMRNATSEEELNLQIIKKTLNVDSQNIRVPPGGPAGNVAQSNLAPSARGVIGGPAALHQPPAIVGGPPAGVPLLQPQPSNLPLQNSKLASHHTTTAAAAVPRPAEPSRIFIKQEDDKPSSSSSSAPSTGPTTTTSPLDLSMRTVKTKADSTEYKYQQRRSTPNLSNVASSSVGGGYTLPRVDSTPVFSVHAFEPGAPTSVVDITGSGRRPSPHSSRHNSLERSSRNYTPPTQPSPQNSRHNSLERSRNYTPPSQPRDIVMTPTHSNSVSPIGSSSTYPHPAERHSSSPYTPRRSVGEINPTMTAPGSPHIKTGSTSSSTLSSMYDPAAPSSCIIKAAPKTERDLPRHTIPQARPSVLETNPYAASVIKTEPTKRMPLEGGSLTVSASASSSSTSSTHHTLAAVERLPPDTSIMPLPLKSSYGLSSKPSAIMAPKQDSPSPANTSQGCERNPNFRKRHIQEYSHQMSASGEPLIKQSRYLDSNTSPGVGHTMASKPIIPMRPADISVIAVNESNQHELLAERNLGSGGVIATAASIAKNQAPVIVNNFNHCNSKTLPPPIATADSSGAVVCKQEPLTPTGMADASLTPKLETAITQQPPSQPRIRTKAELKGFTFNPPPPTVDVKPSEPPSPTAPAAAAAAAAEVVVNIKQESPPPEVTPTSTPVKIKVEEPESTVMEEIEAIPGLEDDFSGKNLLDFGWSNTCNNFVEQLITRPAKKSIMPGLVNKAITTPAAVPKESCVENVTTPSNDASKAKLNNYSNIESAADTTTTRSSFPHFDGGIDSGMKSSSVNQDPLNSPSSSAAGMMHKKLNKLGREKKRYQQEKRLAERLQSNKDSSSETEDELDKRKTERLKKPLMKAKNKLKSKTNSNASNNDNNSSSTQVNDKNQFSDCGSDSSSSEESEEKEKSKMPPTTVAAKKEISMKVNNVQDIKGCEKKSIKQEEDDKQQNKDLAKSKTPEKQEKGSKKDIKVEKEDKTKDNKKSPGKSTESETKKPADSGSSSSSSSSAAASSASSSSSSSESDNAKDKETKEKTKTTTNTSSNKKSNEISSKTIGKFKISLNTMTRSKRKKEMEAQMANSKVLRNDKIIRNSTSKIKRKYVRKYVNNVNSYQESGGLTRESGVIKSARLKAKLERKVLALNHLKGKDKGKVNNNNNNKLKASTTATPKEVQNAQTVTPPNKGAKTENLHDPNVLELYRFKRALKVPPSLISIKHPAAHKIAASLPDLERHASALDAYAKKKKKINLKSHKNDKIGSGKSKTTSEKEGATSGGQQKDDEPRSIIDLLHSRVTKASGLNVSNKSTTTTASKTAASAAANSTTPKTSSTTSTSLSCVIGKNYANSSNNCGMFSETSQTTESSELQMLPPIKPSSDEDDDDDNESATSGKKRHFSIFETTVLPTKTRTESKMQQKRENIREIFVGDDRPASAPPEMTQAPENGGSGGGGGIEKMTYEQTYEQFLQQMNIVISSDKTGRFSRTAGARKLLLPTTTNSQNANSNNSTSLNIKQEEVDTESTSVMDPDELKDDQKSETTHTIRKKRGKYLRRKGSSGFDYIRKKKKPSSSSVSNAMHNHNSSHNSAYHNFSIKNEKMEADEYENKVKTEDDVSREIQKWVLNKGVGQSTMHKAARQGYIDVVVYCLERMNMNPDQKDNAGYTPLHEACTNGWLDIARVLLQYGANHSAAAHSGIRPLHEASENDHEEIVRLLLAYGADPLLATYSGQTPLMLASSTTMRDILNNHLIDVQSMGPERKPWKFNGPWEIYDPSECGYNVFEGAPNPLCDTSRAPFLRKGSSSSSLATNNQMMQNKKQIVLNNTAAAANNSTLDAATTNCNNSQQVVVQNGPTKSENNNNSSTSTVNSCSGSGSSTSNNTEALKATGGGGISEASHHHKGETTTKTVMDKCAVVLDKIDHFNTVQMKTAVGSSSGSNNNTKSEILVENSDSDGEMFEFEEADILLPPLYLLKDEGTTDKWVLLSDLCNLLKVKSKDTLLNKIYPQSSSAASAHKSLMRELKMSDFLEKATCLQLLCAGEKLNICASKVVLIKYNENVRNLLGVKTILMKF